VQRAGVSKGRLGKQILVQVLRYVDADLLQHFADGALDVGFAVVGMTLGERPDYIRDESNQHAAGADGPQTTERQPYQ
jgi:hypothetical protein